MDDYDYEEKYFCEQEDDVEHENIDFEDASFAEPEDE